MPRELAADRRNRLAREQEQLAAERAKTYPTRLMELLYRVSNTERFELTVTRINNVLMFKVTDREIDWREPALMAHSHTTQSEAALEDVTGWADDYEWTLKEAKRKIELRNAAVEKARATFTKEEREALGLSV